MVVTLCGEMAVVQAVAERHVDLHKQLMNGNASLMAKKWCMQLANRGRYSGITWPTPGKFRLSPRKAHCFTRVYIDYLG